MISPIDALRRALFHISSLSSRMFDKKPGAVIERMSERERTALQKLKSSDIDGGPTAERIDDLKYIGSNEYYENKEFEKDKLEFDKKILK
jgi:hypothetical protein